MSGFSFRHVGRDEVTLEFSVVLFDGEWSPEQGGWADVVSGSLDTGDIEIATQ